MRANLLLLPLTFKKRFYESVAYSIPTKLAEYLISGTRILLFAPKNTALAKFSQKNNLTLHFNEKNELLEFLRKIVKEKDYQTRNIEYQKKFAIENFEKDIISSKFKEEFK